MIAFTGRGNFTQGARSVFERLPHEYVRVCDLPSLKRDVQEGRRRANQLYGVTSTALLLLLLTTADITTAAVSVEDVFMTSPTTQLRSVSMNVELEVSRSSTRGCMVECMAACLSKYRYDCVDDQVICNVKKQQEHNDDSTKMGCNNRNQCSTDCCI